MGRYRRRPALSSSNPTGIVRRGFFMPERKRMPVYAEVTVNAVVITNSEEKEDETK